MYLKEAAMAVAEKICEQLQNLPEPLQAEALDFVGYLEAKALRQGIAQEHFTPSEISLVLAMRGMEDEDLPEYSRDDLKEAF
jgi:Protein of unknown function (DUF2281)